MAKPKNEKAKNEEADKMPDINKRTDAFKGLFEEERVDCLQKNSSTKKKEMHPNSIANLKTRATRTAKQKAFMQLNIFEYEDYIYRMSKVNNKTMSQYILDLIEADMQQNAAGYEGLKTIKALDKPPRIARNTKKKREEED